MIVITITVEHKTYTDRIPDKYTRVKRDPEYYRSVRFRFNGEKAIAHYRSHFIYEYLKNAWQNNELPNFIVRASSMEITLQHEKD
jgi:hypothetical protein